MFPQLGRGRERERLGAVRGKRVAELKTVGEDLLISLIWGADCHPWSISILQRVAKMPNLQKSVPSQMSVWDERSADDSQVNPHLAL